MADHPGSINDDCQRDRTDDNDLPTPRRLDADDADAPLPQDALPIDFQIEEDTPLNEQQKRHQVAFYQAALSSFLVQAGNSSMMMKEKWEMIRAACLRLHNGETRYALKRAGYSQIAAWDKKYGIVLVGEEHVLVERAANTRKRKKKRRHPAAIAAEATDNASEGGEEDSDEEISLPEIDLEPPTSNDVVMKHWSARRVRLVLIF